MRRDAAPPDGPVETDPALSALAAEAPVPFRVEGSSMAPGLVPGDRVWIAARRFYWPGDRVAFRTSGGSLLLHRVIGYRRHLGGWALFTQGDASAAPDGPVPISQVLGKVVCARGSGAGKVGPGERLGALGRGLAAAAAALRRRLGRSAR